MNIGYDAWVVPLTRRCLSQAKKMSGKKRLMSPPSTPPTDSTIRLRDGRRLQYLEIGKSDGPPIIHCHGNGSSRLEVLAVAVAAERIGVRLMSLDRPGIGRSDPKPGYRLLDWPDDVVEVADQLGIEQLFLWQGEQDRVMPAAAAHLLAQALPYCTATYYPNDGHLSTFVNHAQEIWKALNV